MEIAPGDELYLVGDKKEYDFDITITNVSDKLGLAAHVDLTMIDIHGETDIVQVRPFMTDYPPPTIDISATEPQKIEDDGSASDDEVGKDDDDILNTSVFIGIIVLMVVVVLVLMGLFLKKSKP